MHNTKTPLAVWFWAAYLMTTDKRGVSALLLQHQLALRRYETAWMMLHEFRRAMVSLTREPKGKDLFGLARDHLARRATERVAGGWLELIASDGDGPFTIRHRPTRLVDVIWQQFAAEIAGRIACTRCPAPGCGRWFPRNGRRSDRQFCCHACQMRAWRNGG